MIRALPVFALVALSACQSAPPRSSADAAVIAACRDRADQIHARQNRVELSRRDERDAPFASVYNSGITTRGLGDRFEWGRNVEACVKSSGSGGDAPTGPTFSPAVPATGGTAGR